ncbi:hypothetical protein MRX96_054038, partial [Rhipicephalus microplus]
DNAPRLQQRFLAWAEISEALQRSEHASVFRTTHRTHAPRDPGEAAHTMREARENAEIPRRKRRRFLRAAASRRADRRERGAPELVVNAGRVCGTPTRVSPPLMIRNLAAELQFYTSALETRLGREGGVL